MNILNKLFEDRVLKVDIMNRHSETTYNFSEACDYWFSVELTKDEVRKLSQELLDLIGD